MLCSQCRTNAATAGDGRCDACAGVAEPMAAAPPAPPLLTGLRSPVGLSRAAVTLLGLVIATDVLSFFASSRLRALMGRAEESIGSVSTAELEQSDVLMGASAVLQTLAWLASVVLFLVWFHRVRANAEVFAPDLQSRGRGWAVGGWFIPFGNLYIPRGVAGDIWAASREHPYAERKPLMLLNLWWTAWLISVFATQVASRQYDGAEAVGELKAAATALMVSDALDIFAAVLAILVVRRITGMQHAKATGRTEPQVAV